VVKDVGVDIDIIGEIVEGSGAEIVTDGKVCDFTPRFRESAYTPIKKMIGEEEPRDFEEMKEAIDKAAKEASEKKKRVMEMIRGK